MSGLALFLGPYSARVGLHEGKAAVIAYNMRQTVEEEVMTTEKIRAKEVRMVKLKPMVFAPAATFKFKNELDVDVEIVVEGTAVSIRKAP